MAKKFRTLKDLPPKPEPKRKEPQPSDGVKWLFDPRAIRKSARVSVRDVAKHSGISAATISRIERGYLPDIITALRMAAFYGLKIDEMWSLSK